MIDWSPLRSALARCRADNISVPIWWRDDDAIEPSAALDRLSNLASDLHIPAHLAVIPAHAQNSLVPAINDDPFLHPLVHGWAHRNTAPEGQKKSEFGVPREHAILDATRALTRMQTLFGKQLIAMFVPPWNRIDAALVSELKSAGYGALSTFGPRSNTLNIAQINTHIDPIFWRGHRGLVDPNNVIEQTVTMLDARRISAQDASEPLGYLTHHLVHDDPIWDFSRGILSELQNGGATCVTMKDYVK